MKQELPEGFYITIHRSLSEPLMMAGLPRHIAILNGAVVMAFVMGAHNLWILPLGILSHVILSALHKKDADILAVLRRNLQKPSQLRV